MLLQLDKSAAMYRLDQIVELGLGILSDAETVTHREATAVSERLESFTSDICGFVDDVIQRGSHRSRALLLIRDLKRVQVPADYLAELEKMEASRGIDGRQHAAMRRDYQHRLASSVRPIVEMLIDTQLDLESLPDDADVADALLEHVHEIKTYVKHIKAHNDMAEAQVGDLWYELVVDGKLTPDLRRTIAKHGGRAVRFILAADDGSGPQTTSKRSTGTPPSKLTFNNLCDSQVDGL